MDSFELKTNSGVVPIRFSEKGANWVAAEIAQSFGMRRPRLLIVTDEHVALHHLESLKQALAEHGFGVEQAVLPPGEEQKNFARQRELLDTLAQKHFARDDVVLAMGGGVITDLAGFAASVYLRGIEWIALPTSLLGMVDAAIGGKTGINHALGKNLIGAFHQPRMVLSDVTTLRTLPERELLSGAAEIVKGALLAGGEFWKEIESAGPDALHWTQQQLHEFICKGAKVKIEIVSRDERESGERMLLNLGHTFGHALEQTAGYGTLAHGEAVFYGMRAAAWLSARTGVMVKPLADKLESWFARIELPAAYCAPDGLVSALQSDKKSALGKLRWILLRTPGEPVITQDVSSKVVHECAEWLCAVVEKGRTKATESRRKLRIVVLNGPNLNLLGEREPAVYGKDSYDDLVKRCHTAADDLNCEVLVRQTNHEGEFVDLLQWTRRWADGVILNPGAYTHTSVAIRDALAASRLSAIEVHLSDPEIREAFRHTSLIGDLCRETVKGYGTQGYSRALAQLVQILAETRGQERR